MIHNNLLRGLSIDIGYTNLCLYIEEFDRKELMEISDNCPKSKRWNKDGTCSKEFQKVIDKVCKIGRRIYLEDTDLTYGKGVKSFSKQELFNNCVKFLDENLSLFSTLDFIIIELQLKQNPPAQQLESMIFGYFTIKFGLTIPIICFPASHKTKTLGMKKPIKSLKPQEKKKLRKKWSIDHSRKIAIQRKDKILMYDLKQGKADDKGDVINQLQAFKYRVFLDKQTP